MKPLEIITNALLFVLFLGLAATVDYREFRAKFREPRAIIAGVCCQFGIVPALGYLSTQLFELDAVLGVTLLILCSSPGGSYSNWWCSLGNADLALSVAMTTTSTFVSMIMLPVNTLIYIRMAYGTEVPLNWASLVTTLLIAVCAIGSGLYCGAKRPDKKGLFNVLGQVSGLAMIAISTIFSSRNDPIWNRDATFYAATSLPCVGALLISSFVASLLKLRKPEMVAVVIETAYQNVGLATSIAVGTFEDDAQASVALGVPLFYGVLEAVLIALWCAAAHFLEWSYAPPGTSLWKAVAGNFQPVTQSETYQEDGRGGMAVDQQLDGMYLTEVNTRERTSSATSSVGGSSPRQPYSPPAMRSAKTLALADATPSQEGQKGAAAAAAAADDDPTGTPPSDPGGTPPTTPTRGAVDAQAGTELFVSIPAEAGDVQAPPRLDAGVGEPELGSPHHAPPPSPLPPSSGGGSQEETWSLELTGRTEPSSPRSA